MRANTTIDPDRLEFPSVIAPIVGLSTNEITFLKKRGCPFYGRKTSVRWVRDFVSRRRGRWQRNPLHRFPGIVNIQPGVNSMHQAARMIHKAHSLLFGQSGAVASRDKRHPQRVRCCPYRSLEHSVEPLIHFACQPWHGAILRSQWPKDFFNCPVIGTGNNLFGSSGFLCESSTQRIIFSRSIRSVGMLDSAKRQPI
jgi:hypothetical protein